MSGNSKYTVLISFFVVFIAPASGFSGKIIGGQNSSIERHPYMLQLFPSPTLYRAATVIHDMWALTAAHCVFLSQGDVYVYAGSSFLKEGGVAVAIVKIIQHEWFKVDEDATLHNDIALLKAERPFSTLPGVTVQPAMLPTSKHDVIPEGTLVTACGWGRTEDASFSKRLLEIEIPVDSMCTCYNMNISVDESQFCSIMGDEYKHVYYGVSGGPALIGDTVVGIISYNVHHELSMKIEASVFFRVSWFVPWIHHMIFLDEYIKNP